MVADISSGHSDTADVFFLVAVIVAPCPTCGG